MWRPLRARRPAECPAGDDFEIVEMAFELLHDPDQHRGRPSPREASYHVDARDPTGVSGLWRTLTEG